MVVPYPKAGAAAVSVIVAIGTGSLLSPSSYDAMTGPYLLVLGTKTPLASPPASRRSTGTTSVSAWCAPDRGSCRDPELTGFSATEAYLPAQEIAIAVAVTYLPAAFDTQRNYANSADALFRSIEAVVAPDDAPPVPNG